KAPLITLPGEHDVIGDTKPYFAAFGRAEAKDGWFSFDQGGLHFVGLLNVFNFEKMGLIGQRQLGWLKADLQTQSSGTPIVVLGHVPLYALYPKWGWTTEDGSKALAMLQRFDNVTVLNGHIHQIIQHQEGNIRFATAAATAYPQPAPGNAEKAGTAHGPARPFTFGTGISNGTVKRKSPCSDGPFLNDRQRRLSWRSLTSLAVEIV
ncbi:MAG: metallophosphoesterase, partial [Candidatus Eremiobacteraeota bacterium]|nr:metallophosphoesterase [Candidatus Eremiobacteraeota bacterium]